MQFGAAGGFMPGSSFVHRKDAFIKLLCLLLLLASVIFADTFMGYLVVAGLMMVIIRLSELRIQNALRGIRGLWLFFLIIFLMNALFTQEEEMLWQWWILGISWKGIVQGATVVVQVAFAMVLGNLLLTTTSPLEITGALETLIYPFKFLGVPVQDVAMILGVAIQFVPTFVREADTIRKAQAARGGGFESRKFREKAHSMISLVVPIFVAAFSRADELSVAMEARGYGRRRGKVRLRKRNISVQDIVSLLICCIVCAAEIIIF